MEQIGIKFILESNQFFMIALEKQTALDMMRNWMNGSLAPMIGALDMKTPEGTGSWAVKTSSIIAIHTFDIEEVKRQAMGQQQPMPQNFQQQPPNMVSGIRR